MKLNIGCGNTKIDGYLNLDKSDKVETDLTVDVSKGLPFQDDSADEILFFHTIEHIEEKYHVIILEEFWRILKPEGLLLISYPEFAACAQNYIDNYKGMKDFWKNTIYGLQRYPGDFHVALMDSDLFSYKLQECGFVNIEWQPEYNEPYNTIMKANKGPHYKTYEELLRSELFEGE